MNTYIFTFRNDGTVYTTEIKAEDITFAVLQYHSKFGYCSKFIKAERIND
jgi:hypothetical protein